MRSILLVSSLLVLAAVLGWFLLGGFQPEDGSAAPVGSPGAASRTGTVEPSPSGPTVAPAPRGAAPDGEPGRTELVEPPRKPAPTVAGPTRTWRGRLLLAEGDDDPAPLAGAPLLLLQRVDARQPVVEVATLRTAADGSFAVEAPRTAGFLALMVADTDRRVPIATVVHEQGQSGPSPDGSEPPADAVEIGDRVVTAPGSLRLEVVDEATGRPVGAGAKVAVKVDVPVRVRSVRMLELLRDGHVQTQTDAGGFAVVEGLPRGRAEYVVHDGVHRPRWGLAEITAGGAANTVRVELRVGHPLRGRVVDADGRPVAGAEVALRGYGAEHHALGGDQPLTTDADGAFAWRDLAEGSVKLMVSAELHPALELSLQTGTEVREVRLPRGHPLTVRLRGDLGEVAPTDVRLEFDVVDADRRPGGFDWGRFALKFGRFTLDENAAFHFPKAVAGSYRVRALVGAAGNTDWADFEVGGEVDGGVEVELTFEPTGQPEVVVQVVDEDGAPVVGAEVLWRCGRRYVPRAEAPRAVAGLRLAIDRNDGTAPAGITRTDGEGRVTVTRGNEQQFEVAATAPGFWPAVLNIAADEVAGLGASVELVLRRAGAVAGAVRGAHVDARTLLSVVVADAEGRRLEPQTYDGSGTYRIEPLLPGRYRLSPSVRAPNDYDHGAAVQPDRVVGVLGSGTLDASAAWVDVRAGETATADLEFPAAGAVIGRVLRGGVPFAGAEVFAVRLGEDGGRETPRPFFGRFEVHGDEPPLGAPVSLSDRDGRYRFRVVGPGTHLLWVRHRDGFVSSGPVRVEARTDTEQVVDLALGDAGIEGRIDAGWLARWEPRGRQAFVFRDDDVADDAFAMQFGELPRSASLAHTAIGTDGAFRFDHLPAGRYVLRFTAGTARRTTQVPVEVGAGQVVDVGVLTEELHEVTLRATLDDDLLAGAPDGARLRGVVRQRFDGFAQPAFVAIVGLPESGPLRLPRGRYEVELERFVVNGFHDIQVQPLQQRATFRVGEGGEVEPAVLEFAPR